MSALPPKADMCSHELDVCFVPIADIAQQAASVAAGQVTLYNSRFQAVAMGRSLCRAPCCCSC